MFSVRERLDRIDYLLARIRHIAQDQGFSVSKKHTCVVKPAARQTMTGIGECIFSNTATASATPASHPPRRGEDRLPA